MGQESDEQLQEACAVRRRHAGRKIDVEDEAVTFDRVIRTIEPARRPRLVILDSCRDKPSLGLTRDSDERGLPPNTLIAYAQRPG
jgi:hypothetical protein